MIKPLHPQLDEAAAQALARWMFVPGMKDGVPVPVRVEVEMSFALRDDPPAVPRGPAVDSPEVFKPGKEVTTPVVVQEVKPGYPPSAMFDGAQGSVYLACVVLPGGTVGDVRLKQRVHPDLDEEAVRSLRRWTFKPGTKDGIAVPVQVEVQMSFSMGKSPKKR